MAAPAVAAPTRILDAIDLYKAYTLGRASVPVLRGCSMSVATGEFLAIMGKSGSGKSTLLHILGALDVPQRGQVRYAERDLFAPEAVRRTRVGVTDALSAAEIRRNGLRGRDFGFVFQFYHLLPELSVLDNVRLPRMVQSSLWGWWRVRGAARADALALLRRVGLEARAAHRPNELSGGERQRVAIARALINRPAVLLADEPTGNLDAESGANIMSILKSLHHEGQTIVMVTHDPAIAAHADRIVRLEDGKARPE